MPTELQGLGWDTRLRTWILLVQSQAGLPVPLYPTGTGGGARTRMGSRLTRVWSLARLPVTPRPPACAARVSNPVPPGKGRVHHQSCLQRSEPRRGIEPRSSAWKAGALADVLARLGRSGWGRDYLGNEVRFGPPELPRCAPTMAIRAHHIAFRQLGRDPLRTCAPPWQGNAVSRFSV